MKTFAVLIAAAVSSAAFADTTGPGAKLTKLPAKWVSGENEAVVAPVSVPAAPAASIKSPVAAIPAAPAVKIPTAVAPVAASSAIPGYTPDSNYSGACHVTVNIAQKTYSINNTSSNGMVNTQKSDAVCLPTEKLAIDYGFKKSR
jgi:hypothetical protein